MLNRAPHALIFAALMIGAVGCRLHEPAAGALDPRRSALLAQLLKGYTSNQFDGWRAHVAADAAASWNNVKMTGEELVVNLAAAHEAFASIEVGGVRIVTVAGAGGAATSFVRTDWAATIRANGKRVELPLQMCVDWSGDQIVGFYEVFDNAVLLQAMGAGG